MPTTVSVPETVPAFRERMRAWWLQEAARNRAVGWDDLADRCELHAVSWSYGDGEIVLEAR